MDIYESIFIEPLRGCKSNKVNPSSVESIFAKEIARPQGRKIRRLNANPLPWFTVVDLNNIPGNSFTCLHAVLG